MATPTSTTTGTTANDTLNGGNGNDIIDGGAGNDTINGGNGNDLVFGGIGRDILLGGNGNDTVFGGAGNDLIGSLNADPSRRNEGTSENGGDILYGDGWNSYADYRAGNAALLATGLTTDGSDGLGNDLIFGGNGSDTIYGDNGTNLEGSAAGGNDVVWAGNGDDVMYGEGGDDELHGENGNDSLYGGAGNDLLDGGGGNDMLSGGSGNDTLIGGEGADSLTGGSGNDRFVYKNVSESTAASMDTITDFHAVADGGTERDRIDLDAIRQVGGSHAGDMLVWSGHAPAAYGVWSTQSGGNTFVYADQNGDQVADLVIKLTGLHALDSADFIGITFVNHAAAISGTYSGSVVEAGGVSNSVAGVASASGTVNVSDLDPGQAVFQTPAASALNAVYGTFTFNSTTGAWSYLLDNSRAATQALIGGQLVHETLSVSSLDGTATESITVDLTGANDIASITGTATGSVIEAGGVANGTAGSPNASGTLSVSDVDLGEAGFQAVPAAALHGTYGEFTFNASTGAWTYTLDDNRTATQALLAGQTAHDMLNVASIDGSGTQLVDITITGANDDATILGAATGSVFEAGGVANGTAGNPDASGSLSVTDVDAGQSVFQAVAPAAMAGTYGDFTFNDLTGAWTYTLDDSRAATQALVDAAVVHDTLNVTSSDGTASQTIDVTVTGSNDNASITGTATASVLEAGGVANGTAGNPDASGSLSVSDVDAGQAVFQTVVPAALTGTYGDFTFNELTGAWTYALDDSRTATQALVGAAIVHDTLNVTSSDGTASETIDVTVAGSNDNASITGTGTGSVVEAGGVANGTAGNPNASGSLSVSDVDAGESVFQSVTPAALTGTYGDFTFNDLTGAWTYTLDDSRAATQALVGSAVVHDTLNVTSSDGTASETIDVTVTGSNDDASITGTATGSVLEAGGVANGTPGNPNASGSLSVSDVDSGEAVFQSVAPGALTGTYGDFTFNELTGAWTYTLDDSRTATQALVASAVVHDTLNVTSSDGTANETIDITVTGSNDDASITGNATGSVIEAGGVANGTAGNPNASGSLSVGDVDAGQAVFQTVAPAALTGTYGDFTFNELTGAWTYALDDSRTATQALVASAVVHDTLTVTSSDGTASETIDVTVTGSNDDASITGTATGSVLEAGGVANGTPGNPNASGSLAVSDVDSGEAVFQSVVPGALTGTYGDFTFNELTGAWTYTLDDSRTATQALVGSAVVHDSLDVTSSDGTASETIDITVTGSNDDASITGTATGSVLEAGGVANGAAGNPNASGSLSVSDVDAGEAVFQAVIPSTLIGTYGDFTFNELTGAWTYTLDDSRTATQALVAGATVHDTLNVASSDGTASETIDITVTGSNDDASITGTATGSVVEAGGVANGTAGNPSASGSVSVSDVDTGQAVFQSVAAPALAGTYGDFTFDSTTGAWTYTLDDTRTATQALVASGTVHDTLNVVSSDGTAGQLIDVTVTGSNDDASISGTSTGSVVEAGGLNNVNTGTPSASGALSVSDVDSGEAVFQAPTASALAGTYGNFSFNAATGAWSYTLDDTKSATQALVASQVVHDTLAVNSFDGTASRTIDITVTGANDTAVFGGTSSGSVVEAGGIGNGTAGTPTASGTLTVTDVDAGQSGFQAPGSLAGTYGTFTFNASTGAWGYTLDNTRTATQALVAGQVVHDTLSITSTDSSASQVIDVTVTGANDTPTIGETSTGTVTEAGGVNNATAGTPGASGTLTISDVDSGQASFQSPASLAGTFGTFTFNGTTGAWTYALDNARTATQVLMAGQVAHDILTVTSLDGSASRNIDVTVNGSNDSSVSTADVIYVSNNTNGIVISASALLANDTDLDGLALSITGLSGATGGVSSLNFVTGSNNALITFNSNNSASGAFDYTVSDGAGGTATAHVTVNIMSTNGTSTVDLSAITYQASYLDGGSNSDTLTGAAAPDIFLGGAADDTLNGGSGDDVIQGGSGNDTMNGGAGTDLLSFADVIGFTFTLGAGGSGTATVNGTDPYSNFEGVLGSSGNDNLTGNAGDNVLRGAGGNDTLDGAGGIDLLDFSDATGAINFTLVQSSSNTLVNLGAVGLGTDTYRNMEGVIGSSFNDTLTGSAGNDVLKGGAGNDVISAGAGLDTLYGGPGADTLTGGTGKDTFAYSKADATGVDAITDFSLADGDVLDISDLLTNYNPVAPDASIYLYDDGTKTSVAVDRDGTGSTYGFQDIAVLQNLTGSTLAQLLASGNIAV